MTALAVVAVPDALRANVERRACAAFPDECCGYLVGPAMGTSVDEVVACRNAQGDGLHPTAPQRSAETGFVIAGDELFAFARSFDSARPARIVYHSHPNGRAYFSALDREVARQSGYPVQHLVVGVSLRGVAPAVTEIAQFALDADADDFIEVFRWPAPMLR